MFKVIPFFLLAFSAFGSDSCYQYTIGTGGRTELVSTKSTIHNFDECLEEIVVYAPDIFEMEVYEIEESELSNTALRISNIQNEKSKNHALSVLYANNLNMPVEIREQILKLGINFSYNSKTKSALCSAIDEAVTDREVHLTDDYYEMTRSEVKTNLMDDIEYLFQGIESAVDIFSFECSGKLLYTYKDELLNPDYWDLEDHFLEDMELIPEVVDEPISFSKHKSEDTVTINNFNFKVEFEVSDSCKGIHRIKDSLATTIHNKLLGTSKLFPNRYNTNFIYSQEVKGCYMSIQYKYVKKAGLSIEEFIEFNF
ncbi:MAG: hypothetical protein ACJAS4_002826 [Bacteriovoracaceae bacterium]|jgi:hypothetical protein